jgi:hypothetical protein
VPSDHDSQESNRASSMPEPEDSERSRFAQLAKKLVRVPKKEIDEKAEQWKRERGRRDSG